MGWGALRGAVVWESFASWWRGVMVHAYDAACNVWAFVLGCAGCEVA